MSHSNLTDPQRKILELVQGDLPDGERPFDEWASRLGVETSDVIREIESMLDAGVLRKFSAALNHRKAGFTANAMCVWAVPPERVEEVGRAMASFPEVTHCYSRPTQPGWPFSIFCMVHGRTREETEQVARRMADRVNVRDYRLIFSVRELKKRSFRLAPHRPED